MVYIVTDSTAGVPAAALHEYRDILRIIQLKVIMDGREINESEITQSEVYEFVARNKIHPKTSQPAPGEVAVVLDSIAAAGDSCVGIFLSGGISGTYANIARQMQSYPKGRFFAVDSHSSTIGEWHMVKQALDMARAGASAPEIYEIINEAVQRNHLYIIVDTLEYLHKGGRIGGAKAFLGSLLGVKPILCVDTGSVEVLDKARTFKRAVQRIVEQVGTLGQCEWFGVSHNNAPDLAEAVAAGLRSAGASNVEISANGAVVGVHVGPKAVAVFVQHAKR